MSRCWAVGIGGTIVATTDGGATWTAQASGTATSLFNVFCASTSQCWAVGDGSVIRATTTGGATWFGQASGTPHSLRDVSCPTTSRCWATGDAGTIVATSNGGSTWSPQTSGIASNLPGGACPSTTQCWAVGSGGTIIALAPPGAPTILDTPPNPSTTSTAAFGFAGEQGARFECSLDSGGFVSCGTPHGYSGLAEGSHTFQVRQVDESGNVSPPASYTWTIDLPECGDGTDNDSDGHVDYPNDPGCANSEDNTEGGACDPVAAGVVICLTSSTELFQVNAVDPNEPGASEDVVGHVDIYRFVLPGGISTTLPCVVLSASGTHANPCAAAGGTFVSRTLTLGPVVLISPATNSVGVCIAELRLTVNGIGIQSAPAYTIC